MIALSLISLFHLDQLHSNTCESVLNSEHRTRYDDIQFVYLRQASKLPSTSSDICNYKNISGIAHAYIIMTGIVPNDQNQRT